MPGLFDDLPMAKSTTTSTGGLFDDLPDATPEAEARRRQEESVSRVFSSPRFAASPMGGIIPPSPEELQKSTIPIGKGLSQAGRDVRDTLAAGMLLATGAGTEEARQQIVAPEEEKPYTLAEKTMSTPARFVYNAASGALQSAPRLAAMTAAQAAGVPAWLAGAGAFGMTEEGFSPKEAAIAAILPGLGKWGGELTGAIAKQLGVPETVIMNVVRGAGHVGGPAGLLSADAVYRISQLPPEQRKEAAFQEASQVFGMLVMILPGGLRELQTVRGQKMLSAELGRVLAAQVKATEGAAPRAGAGAIPAEAVAAGRMQVGAAPTAAEPFLRPEVQKAAGEALAEAQKPPSPLKPWETAADRLKAAAEKPFAPEVAAPSRAEPGIEETRGVSAPREPVPPEPETAELRARLERPSVTEEDLNRMGSEDLTRVDHGVGLDYGATLKESDIPRIRTEYEKAQKNMREAFASGDKQETLRAFARNNFYGGALATLTKGAEGAGKGNYDLWAEQRRSAGLPVPGEPRPSPYKTPAYREAVRQTQDYFTKALQSPEYKHLSGGIDVVPGVENLPPRLRNNIENTYGENADSLAAFYDLDSGKVIFNSQHPRLVGAPPQALADLMVHEVSIHRGLRVAMGEDRFREISRQIFQTLEQKDITELLGKGYQARPDILGEEWLAHAAERVARTGISSNAWTKVAGFFRQLWRDMFKSNLKFTDQEIANLIAKGTKGAEKYTTEFRARNTAASTDVTQTGARFMLDKPTMEEMEKRIAANDPASAVYRDAIDLQNKIDQEPTFLQINNAKKWLEKNTSGYVKSVDPDLLCQKSAQSDLALKGMKETLGKSYNTEHAWELLRRAEEEGLDVPCYQCYLWSARTRSGTAMQKPVTPGVGAYKFDVERLGGETVDFLQTYGLRHYSSTDAKVEHFPGLMTEFVDLAKNKIPAVGYTKDLDFIDFIGPTGSSFNISVGRDSRVSVQDVARARALRQKHPNIGIVYVGFSDAEILRSLSQKWIDHLIPWHGSSQSRNTMVERLRDPEVVDYTREQNEVTLKNGMSVDEFMKLPIDEMRKILGDKTQVVKSDNPIRDADHNGDMGRYMALVKKRNVVPKFPSLLKMLQERGESQNYMKLIGPEYGKSDSYPYQPPDLNFGTQNIDAVIQRRRDFIKSQSGTYDRIGKQISREVLDGTFEPRPVDSPAANEGTPMKYENLVFRRKKGEAPTGEVRGAVNLPESKRAEPTSYMDFVWRIEGAANRDDLRVIKGWAQDLYARGTLPYESYTDILGRIEEQSNAIGFGQDVRGAISRPGLEKEYNIFQPVPKPGVPLKKRVLAAAESFRTGVSSKFRPVNKLAEDIAKSYGLTSRKDIAGQLEQLKGSSGKAEADIYRFDQEVGKLVGKDEEDFNVYMFLRRTLDRLRQDQADIARALAGEEVPTLNRRSVGQYTIPEAESKLRLQESQMGPEKVARFQQAADAYQQHMDKALALQVESGRMSQEIYNAIKTGNQFYAPFKVMKYIEESTKPEGTGKKVDTLADFTKAMKGIEEQELKLGSMLPAARQNIFLSRILADKTRVMQEFAKLAEIDTQGLFIQKMFPGQEPPKGKETINVFLNGQKWKYAVDPSVATAVQTYGRTGNGILARFFRNVAAVFRASATGLNVPFQVSNLMADVPRAALVSKYGLRAANDFYAYPIEFVKAIYSSMKANVGGRFDQRYQDFLDSGAAGVTVQEHLTPRALQFEDPAKMSPAYRAAHKILWLAPEIATAIEQTSKILGVQRAMRFEKVKSGAELAKKVPEAVTEVRRFSGSPDFGRMGSVIENYNLNLLQMFLNARVQGVIADVGRLAGRDGRKTAAVTWGRLLGAVGIPTAILYWINRQPGLKEDYDKRPQQEKNNYWLLPKSTYIINENGEVIRDYWRLPKREVGKWVSNLIESSMRFAEDADPENAAKFGQFLIEDISPVNIQGKTFQERGESILSGLHPLIKAPIEFTTGRDLYRHQEYLKSDLMKKAPPEMQFTDRTATAFVKLAQAIPDVAPDSLRSPIMLEALVRNFTAGMITQFLPSRKPIKGRSAVENWAVLQRFQSVPYTDNQDFSTAMEGYEREAAGVQLQRDREARDLVDKNKGKFPGDYLPADVDPKMAKRVVDLWIQDQMGVTSQDRRVMALPPEQRAKYILEFIKPLTPEQKSKAIEDFARKRILTGPVFQFMGDALQ